MFIDTKVTLDLSKQLEKRLKAIADREVSIGMFKEQGEHYSGFTYVNLLRYHAGGDPRKNLPPRNPLYIAKMLNPVNTSPLKANLRKHLSNLKTGGTGSAEKVLEGVGEFYRDKVRDVFGDEGLLQPKTPSTQARSNSPGTPMMEEGSLASKVAYKIDDQPPKEVGR